MSRTGVGFATPDKTGNPFESLNPRGSRKRKQVDFSSADIKEITEHQHTSASPAFKKAMPACRSPIPARTAGHVEMDTDPEPRVQQVLAPAVLQASAPALINPDFLSGLDKKLDLLTTGMLSISAKVDNQEKTLAENSAKIARQADVIEANSSSIRDVFRRLDKLEGAGLKSGHVHRENRKAVCSPGYLLARRSIRMWPIQGLTSSEMWESVGDFIHETLRVPETEVNQTNLVEIKRVEDTASSGIVKQEVLVTFHTAEVRDLVMSYAVSLSGSVDATGRPLAGLRLEVPDELLDTFRLLSRFGTRLRARHGEGTKRHIKFDDYNASLLSVIKLPGDNHWTRVTPDMAMLDLDASVREEQNAAQKRLASKLLPGPRERLSKSAPQTKEPRGLLCAASTSAGLRPRKKWGAPAPDNV